MKSAFFTQRELERARDYRSGQRLIFVGSLAAEGALLVLLASGRPAPVQTGLERLGERPVLGGAAAAAGLSVAVAVVTLPFGIAAHERSVDVGLSTQEIGDWAVDWLKATGIGALLAGAVGTAALALIRRFGGRWWIPGSARGGGRRRRLHLARSGDPRPAVQQVRAARAGQGARRRDRTRRARRDRHRRGLPSRRQPPEHRDQRLRQRPRPEQASGPLRHPAQRPRPRGAPLGDRPRARARPISGTSSEACSSSRSWRR